jgi:hypothetical protein
VSRTYRDISNHWDRKLRPKRSKARWKNEATEDFEMDNDTVYVIINEWSANDESDSLEIVGGLYFSTEQKAWDGLDQIAETYDVELLSEDTSFDVPSDGTYETYYIMELRKHGIDE